MSTNDNQDDGLPIFVGLSGMDVNIDRIGHHDTEKGTFIMDY